MKISKDALKAARQLFQLTMVDGRIDDDRARKIVKRVTEEKPRDHHAILHAYLRLVRLEFEKRHAVIESAVDLPEELSGQVIEGLKRNYGDDLTAEFSRNESLIAGMRVRVGSDVWDGSVRGRIERLRSRL